MAIKLPTLRHRQQWVMSSVRKPAGPDLHLLFCTKAASGARWRWPMSRRCFPAGDSGFLLLTGIWRRPVSKNTSFVPGVRLAARTPRGMLDIITGYAPGKPLAWRDGLLHVPPAKISTATATATPTGLPQGIEIDLLQRRAAPGTPATLSPPVGQLDCRALFDNNQLGAALEDMRNGNGRTNTTSSSSTAAPGSPTLAGTGTTPASGLRTWRCLHCATSRAWKA